MKTLPTKFLLVLKELDQRFSWYQFYKDVQQMADGSAKIGRFSKDTTRTVRIDIKYGYFKYDEVHWRAQGIRDRLGELFPNAKLNKLEPGSTIMMIWTTDTYWLENDVLEIMERWNGRGEEPRSLWQRIVEEPFRSH